MGISISDFREGIFMVILWMAVAVIMVVIEGLTQGLTTIWFAGGAVVAAGVSLISDSLLIQFIAAVIVSALLVYFTRPWAKEKFNRKIVPTNISAVIGQTGVAESDILTGETGTVKADNKLWTAILTSGGSPVRKGESVEIMEVQGVKLVVRAAAGAPQGE